LFVWGQLPAGANPPATDKVACRAAASVSVTPDASGHDQLASFTVGMAPQLLTPNWATGSVSVTQPAAVQVPVKFWLLARDPHCDVACKRDMVNAFLDWSNDLLERERAGVELVAADPAVVSDQTTNPSPDVDRFRVVSETRDCTNSRLTALAAAIKTPGALNMYLVRRVGSGSDRGTVCFVSTPPPRDMEFVGADASYGTMLHEIGHNLGLIHSNGLAGLDQHNLMWQESDVRDFVTEGQVFWMHFFNGSALPGVLGVRPGLARSCVHALSWPCPPQETKIWPD
jgi:hypothetical protein